MSSSKEDPDENRKLTKAEHLFKENKDEMRRNARLRLDTAERSPATNLTQKKSRVVGPKASASAISIKLEEIMRRSSFHYPGMDDDAYDFAAERTNANSTIIPSIMYMIKGSLGCAFLCVHEAWRYCGLWTSLIVAGIISLLVLYSYRMIVSSAQKMYVRIRVPTLSYAQLAEAALAFGPLHCSRNICRRCKHAVNVWIFFDIMGTLCVYAILMAKTLKHSFEFLSPKISSANLNVRVYVVFLIIPLILLSMIRNLRVLVILATVADLYIILCIAIAIYQSMLKRERLDKLPAWNNVFGLFKFAAVFAFAIDGSYTVLPTENHMHKPRYFYIVTDISTLMTSSFVAAIGFCGYWAWGSKTESPFTIHMSKKTPFMFMQLILTLFFATLFTMHLFIPFEILWHYATKKFKWVKAHPRGARVVISVQVMLLSCVAIACPFPIEMICFLGVVCSAWLLFILPAVIESFVSWDERQHSKIGLAWHFLNLFYILIGFTLFFGGIVSIIHSFCFVDSG